MELSDVLLRLEMDVPQTHLQTSMHDFGLRHVSGLHIFSPGQASGSWQVHCRIPLCPWLRPYERPELVPQDCEGRYLERF